MNQKIWLLIFIPFILSLMVGSVYSGTDTITPSDDVFVYSVNPDKNYNYYPPWTNLQVSRSGSIYWSAWLKFTIPPGLTIETAELYLYQYDGSFPPNPNVTIHYSTDDSWTENSITWNNQPSAGSSIDSETVSVGDTWYSWTVTSVVSSGDIVSFVLNSTIDEGYTYFCAKENADSSKKPYLHITYSYDEEWEGEESDITILNVPLLFGERLGISTFSAGMVLTALFLFPLNMILVLWKKGGVIALILNLTFLGLFASISWLPIWSVVLIVVLIFGIQGLKMKDVF